MFLVPYGTLFPYWQSGKATSGIASTTGHVPAEQPAAEVVAEA